MRISLVLIILSIWITGCTQKYFIVRHAEKAQATTGTVMNTPNDPPLTDAGATRALDLATRLSREKIHYIFSTNTTRTQSTAKPTAARFNTKVEIYGSVDSQLLARLSSLHKNVLVVGHSNTVDELVNGLMGKVMLSDLPDYAYDNLFIVRRKGKKITFSREKFGQPAVQ
jgi:broad specificity phosphatase PhoE